MRVFNINDTYSVACLSLDTRNGFKHVANMLVNGRSSDLSVKINYLNRTWERYTYESVLKKLLDKSEWLDEKDKLDFKYMIDKEGIR